MSFGNERGFIDHLQSKEKGGRSMKCPLFMIHILQEPGKVDLAKVDCLKEECAWYEETTGKCAVGSILGLLVGLGNVLGRIHDKMPNLPAPKH